MRNHQGIANPISRIFKWVVGLIIACLFMASAVCRAHDGHEHTGEPIITDTTPTPAPFPDAGQGRLYNEIEMMGIYGSALPPEQTDGQYVPLDNPFLGTNGECQVPTVPLPAAVWAGIAGGAMVLGRRARR